MGIVIGLRPVGVVQKLGVQVEFQNYGLITLGYRGILLAVYINSQERPKREYQIENLVFRSKFEIFLDIYYFLVCQGTRAR